MIEDLGFFRGYLLADSVQKIFQLLNDLLRASSSPFLSCTGFYIPKFKQFVPRGSFLLEIGKCPLKDSIKDLSMRLLDFAIGPGLVHDLKEESLDVLNFPRETIEEHLEDDDAHGPDITFIGIVVL